MDLGQSNRNAVNPKPKTTDALTTVNIALLERFQVTGFGCVAASTNLFEGFKMFDFQTYTDSVGNTNAVLQAEGINYGSCYTVTFCESGIGATVNQSRCDRFIDRFDYWFVRDGEIVNRTGQMQFKPA